MYYIKTFISLIDRLNNCIGRIFSLMVYPLIFISVYEVCVRYIFNRPTIWVHELSAIIYAILFLIGGVYTLRWNAHVKIDIIYDKLSRRNQCILDLFTWILFYILISIMFWEGSKFAYDSILRMEKSSTPWAPYIWPSKLFIPISAFLMLLQGFAKTIKDLYFIFIGKELIEPREGENN